MKLSEGYPQVIQQKHCNNFNLYTVETRSASGSGIVERASACY